MYSSMTPTYPCYSVVSSSPMPPFDLNEDQNHLVTASSSSSLSPYPTLLFNPHHRDQHPGSYYWEQPNHLQSDQEGEKIIPSSGSWDRPPPEAEKGENNNRGGGGLKLKINWKKEDIGNINSYDHQNLQGEDGSSVKWVPSKMRGMTVAAPDQTQTGSDDIGGGNSKNKFEEAKQPLSPLGTDNSSNNSSNLMSNINNNITVRVCSDCHTTKTPLWRSGPRGPKSLCNACGIRQRKARRAMAAAAAASANGTSTLTAVETSHHDVKEKKKKKKKKLKSECAPPQFKKKNPSTTRSRKKKKLNGFEELRISLSKNNLAPQDEKEAAILLMALSYGLLHGFPSDRYLDL